jgi:hypothetical protein
MLTIVIMKNNPKTDYTENIQTGSLSACEPQNFEDKHRVTIEHEIKVRATVGKEIEVRIGDIVKRVPVTSTDYDNFKSSFLRHAPTELQRRNYRTIMNLLRSTYEHAFREGLESKARN